MKRIYVNIDKIERDDKLFHNEFNSLWKTNHPNVVRYLGLCSNTCKKPIEKARSKETVLANVRERLFCLEHIDNGSLDQYITGTILLIFSLLLSHISLTKNKLKMSYYCSVYVIQHNSFLLMYVHILPQMN